MQLNTENRSIIFSEVELTAGNANIEFLASGIPDRYDIEDLDEYIEFAEYFEDAVDISVSVRSYCFGNGESDPADEDELETISEYRDEIEKEYSVDCIQTDSFSLEYEPINEYED